jgi:alpha-mannosidase
MFPTHRQADTAAVESPFDVLDRPIVHGAKSPWFGSTNATFPMQRFVDVSDQTAGLAVINDGLREYEVTQGPDRAIAFTLLRAYQVSLTTVSYRWEPHPEMILSQCPGQHEFRYFICPHAGNWHQAELYRGVERLSVPLEPAQVGAHPGSLPKRHSFLSVEPANLVVSALKRSEDGRGLILRLFNPTNKAITGKVTAFRPIRSAHLLTLEEKPQHKLPVKRNSLTLKVAKKKIVTLILVLSTD